MAIIRGKRRDIEISSAAVTGCLFPACLPAAGKVADRRDLPVFNVGEYRVFYLTAKNETGLVLHGFKAGTGGLSIKNLKLKKSAHKLDLPAITGQQQRNPGGRKEEERDRYD